MTVVGDSAAVAEGLAPVLARHGLEVDFLVECDTGLGRTGVQSPEEAADLAELVDGIEGLRFAGLMTYPSLPETAEWLLAARAAVEARGLSVGLVSAGARRPPSGRTSWAWSTSSGSAPTSTATAPASQMARAARGLRAACVATVVTGLRASGRSSTPARRR
jgi:D-serine deaminase-like pyridoxal phosphate-dependent protein